MRDGIEKGHYRPGQRIRETDVAEWLGVSRTPIRQALRHLETEGLLRFVPWRGVVVAELDRQQVLELYSMRAALEGLAARLAARNIDPRGLAKLEETLAKAAKARNKPKTMARLTRAFHSTIYEASQNRYLMQTLNALRSSLALLQDTTVSNPGRSAQAHEEHLALLGAIRKNDQAGAEALARDHLRQAERARLKVMSDLQ